MLLEFFCINRRWSFDSPDLKNRQPGLVELQNEQDVSRHDRLTIVDVKNPRQIHERIILLFKGYEYEMSVEFDRACTHLAGPPYEGPGLS